MQTLPELNEQERRFVRERLAGTDPAEAYRRAFGDACDKLSPQQIGGKSVQMDRLPRIRGWIEFLGKASPKEAISQLYEANIAFGDTDEAMKAAKQWLDSQFAGVEAADLFIRRMTEIGAEVRFHCECGRMHRVAVGAKPDGAYLGVVGDDSTPAGA